MAQSHAAPAQPPAAELVCKLCNRTVAASDGRQHGRFFRCLPCASIERAMHRNLGTAAEIGTWSHAECHSFFQKLHEEKRDNGNLQWATIRAVLKRRMTERKISSFASTTEVTPLPLSVLLAQGWEEEVVKKFESEKSDTYGVDVFKVPITKFSWRDMFESVEEKLLEQEKEATKRRAGKKNKEDDLDVPEAAAACGKDHDKGKEKKELQELRQRMTHNAKVASSAAKAMGPLATAETSLTKLLAKAEGKEGVDTAAVALCNEKLTTITAWGQQCRAAVNAQDRNKGQAAQEAQEHLEDLPFDPSDLRATLKQITEGQKAVKASMPKAAAAPKKRAGGAGIATGDAGAEAPAPKRRRAKAAP